jgi:putative ABC transport system permease protein
VLLQQVDLGLKPDQVLTADLLLSKRYADLDRRESFVRELLDSIRTLPGVQHVAVHSDSVFGGGGSRETFTIEGLPDPGLRNGHAVSINLVAGDFFSALGIASVRGRNFDTRDTANSAPVAIVNETMVRQFWPDADPIGKRIRFFYGKDPERWLSIVGVVGDARYRYTEFAPQVFVPYTQHPHRSLPYAPPQSISLVVRAATDPAGMAADVQARVWAVDKDQPIVNLQPMDQILWRSVAEPRIYTLLLGSFAAIALVIASAGIYGVSAYAVVRRTREIGIRLAIGATSGQILTLMVGRGMVLNLIGIALGVLGAVALSRITSGFVYGITATDASTFVLMVWLFVAVAFLSTYLPARRAAKIDPALAFRYE